MLNVLWSYMLVKMLVVEALVRAKSTGHSGSSLLPCVEWAFTILINAQSIRQNVHCIY